MTKVTILFKRIIILGVFFHIVGFSYTSANRSAEKKLKCAQCKENDCNQKFNLEKWRECQPGQVCGTSFKDGTVIERYCANREEDPEGKMKCSKHELGMACYCDTDGCNSATSRKSISIPFYGGISLFFISWTLIRTYFV